jgi:hypothetical protein
VCTSFDKKVVVLRRHHDDFSGETLELKYVDVNVGRRCESSIGGLCKGVLYSHCWKIRHRFISQINTTKYNHHFQGRTIHGIVPRQVTRMGLFFYKSRDGGCRVFLYFEIMKWFKLSFFAFFNADINFANFNKT